MAAATTPKPFLLTTSLRAAMSLTALWCVLVLLQPVGSHFARTAVGPVPGHWLSRGTVLPVWYAVTFVLLYRHPDLQKASCRSPLPSQRCLVGMLILSAAADVVAFRLSRDWVAMVVLGVLGVLGVIAAAGALIALAHAIRLMAAERRVPSSPE